MIEIKNANSNKTTMTDKRIELKHYLYAGMKVRHIVTKINKVCNSHATNKVQVLYLRSRDGIEIIDDFLLNPNKTLDFL